VLDVVVAVVVAGLAFPLDLQLALFILATTDFLPVDAEEIVGMCCCFFPRGSTCSGFDNPRFFLTSNTRTRSAREEREEEEEAEEGERVGEEGEREEGEVALSRRLPLVLPADELSPSGLVTGEMTGVTTGVTTGETTGDTMGVPGVTAE